METRNALQKERNIKSCIKMFSIKTDERWIKEKMISYFIRLAI